MRKMTLKDAIELLCDAKIESADYDARCLFKHFAGAKDVDLIDKGYSSSDEALIRAVTRRASREPLQYIIGRVDFYRESYTVTPDCLIPRPDTEILVDYAVKHIPSGARFADLCCGSGCIGISTLKNTENTTAVLADISDGALALSKKNAIDNGVFDRVAFLQCDLLKETVDGELFAVLSNPPYVKRDVYEELEPEIYKEPRIAFVGGDDGADFYRTLTPIYKSKISKDGFIAYEIGYDQADILCEIARSCGMSCEIIKDFSSNPRVCVLRNL